MCRSVTLVLLDPDGTPLGALPPFAVGEPWWPEMAGVVTGARELFGVDVTVLRILATERRVPHGGAITYLAQADQMPAAGLGSLPLDVSGVPVDLSAHPLRAAYAVPGGPRASLRWAARVLSEVGYGTVERAVQQRTWNLSAIWRLDTSGGPVWLKQVPRFFAHEGAVITWIGQAGHGERVPRVIAAEDGRVLLADIDGRDLYGAGVRTCAAVAADVHGIHVASAANVPVLLDSGVPDRRRAHLVKVITEVVRSYGTDPRLDSLTAGLDDRMAAIGECGLPDTLVHGDLHPGNVRGDQAHRVILDWGDSFIGHPGFDILRLAEELDAADQGELIDEWAARWAGDVPGSDPLTAIDLLRPVAALRNAAIYAGFLAGIEPSERPYHESDVPMWLARAADAGDLNER